MTDIERLQRDPYAIYAKRILGLRPMDRPDERVEARARGTAIHAAVEQFAELWDTLPPDEAAAVFAELYVENLIKLGLAEGGLARERILALRAGAWVADLEARRRNACRAVLVEQTGRIRFTLADNSAFTLTAKADRLERADGCSHVLDFKTGAAPTKTQIETFLAPQLTLTGAILMEGGFETLGPTPPGQLVYLRLTGRIPPGLEEIRADVGESEALSAAALSGLKRLLSRYRNVDQPYRSRSSLKLKAQVSDYDHLARVREWSAADEEGEA